jgi:hypothetical protein
MSWIRSEFQFGGRIALFIVGARDIAMRCRDLMKEHRDDPASLAAALEKMICDVRPDLSGAVVEAITLNAQPMRWELVVSHQSFPHVAAWNSPPKRSLELCWACRKELPVDGMSFMRAEGDRCHLVCSEGCVTREPTNARVVEIAPTESWQVEPIIYERK